MDPVFVLLAIVELAVLGAFVFVVRHGTRERDLLLRALLVSRGDPAHVVLDSPNGKPEPKIPPARPPRAIGMS